jgi:lipid-A-disaccharide synthase-like uncharacterized protein
LLTQYLEELYRGASWWDAIGYVGQLVFFSRFIVQWIASERRKESVVPIAFWYLSIIGSLISLGYGLWTKKIPFILAYLFNCIPYVRNLMLIWAKNERAGVEPEHSKAPLAFRATCDHGDPVVAVCIRCREFQCATCVRPRDGLCAVCGPTAVPA